MFLAAAVKPFESTKPIGSIGGFPISVERLDERATLLIHGKHSYRANVSDSATGTIASLEHAVDSIEDRLRERETDLAQSGRQSADLAKQLDQPFVHDEKLATAFNRQQEIIAALEITKNQAVANFDEAEARTCSVVQMRRTDQPRQDTLQRSPSVAHAAPRLGN
jgi:hypothetical protein